MKSALLTLLTLKPWLLNTLIVAALFGLWFFAFGFAKCEYPTGKTDYLPLHGRLTLSVLCTVITGLFTIELLSFLRLFAQ